MIKVRERYIGGKPVSEEELRAAPIEGDALQLLNTVKRRVSRRDEESEKHHAP